MNSNEASVTTTMVELLELSSAMVRSGELRSLDDTALVTAVSVIEKAGRVIDALRVQVAHEVQERTQTGKNADPDYSLAHRLGYPSARGLLKQLTLASGTTIQKRLSLGSVTAPRFGLGGEELPPQFPAVAHEMSTGEIGIDTAVLITKTLQKLSPTVDPEKVRFAESCIVAHATGRPLPGEEHPTELDQDGRCALPEDHDMIRQRVWAYATALDQEGTAPSDSQEQRRFLNIGVERNGLVPVTGAVLPELGAMLGRLFDAINNPRAGAQQTPRFVEVEEEESLDPRSPAQRRHDALAQILRAAMKHADTPSLGGEPVTLVIQASDSELAQEHGTAWMEDAHGTRRPVHASIARHAACSGNILRVAHGTQGNIISLEHHGRIFTSHQRKAILLRDGGCVIPGCDVPSAWCEIHHVQEWSQGGATHTSNGVALCWWHHRNLDRHGWNVTMRDGVPQIQAPPWLDPHQRWRSVRQHQMPFKQRKRHSPHRVTQAGQSRRSYRGDG